MLRCLPTGAMPSLALRRQGAARASPQSASRMNSHRRICAALLSAAIASSWWFAHDARASEPASEGALDRGFGRDGRYLAQTPEQYFSSAAIAVARDGAIFALGTVGSLGQEILPNCRLTRLLPDGRPDPRFGEGGSLLVGDPRRRIVCTDLALRDDGDIVIAGYGSADFIALRYRADGAPDASFGDAGIARASFVDLGFPESAAFDMAVQDDGKIVIAGRAIDQRPWPMRSRFALVRYGQDGRLDAGFGDGGRVLTSFADFSRFDAEGSTVAIQPDGRIVVAGGLAGEYAVAMARYLPDGRLDPSFGQGGRLASYDDLNRGGAQLTVQADGRLLMTRGLLGVEHDTTVVRYLADGRIDPSFQRIRFAGLLTALRVQADGRVLAAGLTGDPNRPQGVVIRLNQDGTRDASFAMEPFRFGGRMDFFQGLALQPGGAIVVLADAYQDDRRSELGVARLRASTYCIADAFVPGRYLGFSADGWFAAAAGGGAVSGWIGRGRSTALPAARLRLLRARDAGGGADAAVFAAEPGRGWGLGQVRIGAPGAARFAILDPRLDDSACGGD